MSKPFIEVFPSLKLDSEGTLLLEETIVERLSSPRKGGLLRVYLNSDHLIPRTVLFDAEREIERQFFGDRPMIVRIYDSYKLNENYTPEVLSKEYRDSILYQLKSVSPLDHRIFKNAKIAFEDESTMVLTVMDNEFARERGSELKDFIESVYLDRFGMAVEVRVEYSEDLCIGKKRTGKKNKKSAGNYESASAGYYEENTSLNNEENTAVNREIEGAEGGEFDEISPSADSKNDGSMSENKDNKSENKDNKSENKANNSDNNKKSSRPTFIKTQNPSPELLYGRDIQDTLPVTSIEDLDETPAQVVIRGRIFKIEDIETKPRDEKKTPYIIKTLVVTDDTDSINVKLFIPLAEKALIPNELAEPGKCVKIKGLPSTGRFDRELTMNNVEGIMRIPEFKEQRRELGDDDKRVELHCHTKMSDMDGISDVKDIVMRAYAYGHPAIAITDHGVVQAFPEAYHAWQDLYKAHKAKCEKEGLPPTPREDFFKVIYGVEAYMVDDELKTVTNEKGQDFSGSFVVFDVETTGKSTSRDRIIEIGAVRVVNGEIKDRFSTFVNPGIPIPYRITKLTSIRDEDVADAPFIDKALPEFAAFCEGSVLVAHNAAFDTGMMKTACRELGLPFEYTYVDTLGMSRFLFPTLSKHRLDTIARKLKIEQKNHHRAVDDAEVTANIFIRFISLLSDMGISTLEQLSRAEEDSPESIAKKNSYHTIILAKNEVGRVNLYRLISISHLKYFNKKPRIPKSLVTAHREGLIIGSACEQGELFRAILEDKPEDEVYRIASFYDYLEIQPIGNNHFLIESEDYPEITGNEDLRHLNKRIVELGDRLEKPVCATCDVHFLDPEDEIYRRIIMSSRKFKDADNQAPLYLHTTPEMLEEFSYLGTDKAMEVVVKAPRLIASMCEQISPVRPDKCAPVIPGSDETLKRICETKALEMYGDPLPAPVRERLDRELNSIITNGFAVMYIIAQKLVWKSMEDGYLVGSRGSVGSSFVATMSGITEVNPLPPHYYCRKCHYSDFESEDVKAYYGRAGCDMPDKVCPVCGEMLSKDGFDIPFETFLGFNGDKEPDIDLNFSGEYQSKAHKYTEVIFGAGQTYRAGTVGTVAEKTAYGFVKKYFEEHNIPKRGADIDRLCQGIAGIRRSTGQHPGGIIVLPLGEEIDSFTPVQHPADKTETDIVTTHFDYHSIDHNLLKLDILGHADPTMIRRLSVLTDTDPLAIPLDDKKVMSLFQSPEALGLTPEQIGGTRTGTRGVPEFGTDFAIGMLLDTKPTCLSDLVRIAGLAHGTDVWLGNAKDLILSGQATISTAICTRDDIMTYLIGMGVDASLSFKIMESVRKGRGLTPDMESAMREKDVPDWYILSCKKIKYMFPKAHAAAYVMMAWRIAWYKINYPLAYYTAYFSIRASAFSYEKMCQGPVHLKGVMKDIEKRRDNKDNVTAQELNACDDCQIVQEMYERGFEFVPIDLYKARARDFQIIDGKIMPSFASVDGLGDAAAESVYQAAMDGKFISKEDLRNRTLLTKTNIETLTSLGILDGMTESNQMSLFDLLNE